MPRGKLSRKKSPWASFGVDVGTTLTVGAESTNAINVAVQVKDSAYNNAAVPIVLDAWLSSDSAGRTPLAFYQMPSSGFAIGTNGTLIPGTPQNTCLFTKGTLAIHSTPEQFKTTQTAVYKIDGAQYTKAAATALTFTLGHVVTASLFGVILVQVNAAGTVSTKVPSATQAYASAALALAALPTPDASKAVLGYIAIANNAVDWTANTDDLTNGSDLTTATFVDAPEIGQYSPSFRLITNATGQVDLTFTETGIKSFYLNLRLPDGTVKTSNVITFA